MTVAANDIVPFIPGQVGALGIFQEEPLFTDTAYISERTGVLSIVPTSNRGGPSTQITPPKSKLHTVQTLRLSVEDTINASELFNVAQFHSVNGMENLATVRNQRLGIMGDVLDLTHEHMLLNVLKGDLLDYDGSSLRNFFTLFSIVQETEIAFDLTNATVGTLTRKLAAVRRTILGHLEQQAARLQHIHVLCSKEFMDDLLVNPDVLAWAKAGDGNSTMLTESFVFSKFPRQGTWHGFVFEEYRVGNIATTAAQVGAAAASWIAADKCIVFPVGPSIYSTFYSPGEHFEALGNAGQPRYARAAADPVWDEHIRLRLQSYPLPICTRPAVLMRGKRGA
jgi:hypothetical protein